MAQSPMGKVVPLGDHPRAKARLSKKESADMLAGCRDLARERMARALSGMLDRVEDDLFDLAEKAPDREAQNAYLDARAQARDKRVAIEATFGQHFVQFFDRKVRGEPALEAPQPDSAELSLVGDEALEETIAVREMSRKLDASCEGELIALSQRMGFLLEKPDLADDANPFSPATICAALKDACDQIEAGFKVRMTLLHQFEQYVEADLQRIYHDLNSHLVERSILPDVRPGVRRAGVCMVRIDFNRLRFLVIDDNAHMRRILRTLLHGFGTREVYEAEDGAAGLEAFTHYMPDIVITDWAMPIFDGLELTQMIRQPGANSNPYVPIIMLTGHSEKKRVIASRDAGVTEFLAKPISAKALYQRILNIVANPRPFIRTKSYFGPDRRRNVNPNYAGPERRKGGKADIIKQQPLLDKAKAAV